ncbi:MAG: hypothetical protein RMJ98_20940, partial [Myxococcales bacterium]|nr:hypothetical protein [Polyangiaceae bacterium]MDW8251770.1 hypothetical protein [Myxococcales bacterium]
MLSCLNHRRTDDIIRGIGVILGADQERGKECYDHLVLAGASLRVVQTSYPARGQQQGRPYFLMEGWQASALDGQLSALLALPVGPGRCRGTMLSALPASLPRSAASEAPLSLAELVGAVVAGLVPMPAESAGYLLLGLADLMARAPLPLDLRAIFLSPEGNLSLLALTTTSCSANTDETVLESQLRSLLGRLLELVSVQAPALSTIPRRPSQGGLAPLIRELEAALIPVNRAAGRRALARLQREVERVRPRIPALLTLSAEPPASPPRPPAPSPPPPAPPLASSPDLSVLRQLGPMEPPNPPRTTEIPSLLPPKVLRTSEPAPLPAHEPTETQFLPRVVQEEPTEIRAPVVEDFSGVSLATEPSLAPLEVPRIDAPGIAASLNPGEQGADAFAEEDSTGVRAPTIPLTGAKPATVEQLLAEFVPSDGLTERELNRLLKQAVGVELSTLPPGVETFAPPMAQDAPPWHPAPEVIPVHAPLPPPFFEPRPPRNPRA